MSAKVRKWLSKFDELTFQEQYEVTVAIFQRIADLCRGGLSDECLIRLADEAFLALDLEESV